jgi:hypothetical protein
MQDRKSVLDALDAAGVTISRDAFAAKSFLSGLPFMDPGNIAVAGWSMGGEAVLKAIDKYFREQGASPFEAAVAISPVCYPVHEPDTPLLLLTGRQDEICRVSLAEALKKKYVDQDWKPEMSLTIYPNAYHSFDMEGVDFESSGRHYRWDPEAAGDAIARTKDFLSRYLERRATRGAPGGREARAGAGRGCCVRPRVRIPDRLPVTVSRPPVRDLQEPGLPGLVRSRTETLGACAVTRRMLDQWTRGAGKCYSDQSGEWAEWKQRARESARRFPTWSRN